MIKKLQAKFIIINMSIATIMLCIIFELVYYFTKTNLVTNNIDMMLDIAEDPLQLASPGNSSGNIRLPFFALQLGDDEEIIATGGGYFDLSDQDFLSELLDLTLDRAEQTGILDEYDLRFCKVTSPSNVTLVFSDISSEIAVLKNLIKSCACIGIISFLIFLALSFYLARWATHPVEEAWRQQRQFVADASHELKTPLTVIMTNAELLQSPDFSEENRKNFISSILVMSKQMRFLVEQMLELARADILQTHTAYCVFNLSELVFESILPFEPVFFENGLILNTDIEENIFTNGDPAQLRQIIDILLDNAQKYSTERGATKITLAKKGKSHILLSVSNTGEEIPNEDLENLFKRFYRADKSRTRTGSFGLGLSIAETIVSGHGGRIWAESAMGVNTFYVELHRSIS